MILIYLKELTKNKRFTTQKKTFGFVYKRNLMLIKRFFYLKKKLLNLGFLN